MSLRERYKRRGAQLTPREWTNAASVMKYSIPMLLTVAGLLIGMSQYIGSQIMTDIRHFEQAYFAERLVLFKNVSSSTAQVMVDIQMKNVEGFKASYKSFKTNYWHIQLVRDSLYTPLLEHLHAFDGAVRDFVTAGGKVNADDIQIATHAIKLINQELNQLLLNERKKINDPNYLSHILPWNWLGAGRGEGD